MKDFASAFGLATLGLISFAVATYTWLAWEARHAPKAEDCLPHSHKCAWCGTYASELDRELAEEGALTTHGICDRCSLLLEN